ncbi:hypothetical protein [Kribbella sp. NPDC051718]|uniref:hypothetical protein n=1 Tax=Kribbella sp. NPDC051718 TaxID=3155168 RepID=UPI00342CD045
MRERLNSTPTWALLLIFWLAWAAVTFAIGIIETRDLLWSVVSAAVISLVIATGMALAIKARLRWENGALGDAPKDHRRLALKAAWKGPIPTDPELRATTLAVAQEQLRQMRRGRPLQIIAISLAVISAIGLAVTNSPGSSSCSSATSPWPSPSSTPPAASGNASLCCPNRSRCISGRAPKALEGR